MFVLHPNDSDLHYQEHREIVLHHGIFDEVESGSHSMLDTILISAQWLEDIDQIDTLLATYLYDRGISFDDLKSRNSVEGNHIVEFYTDSESEASCYIVRFLDESGIVQSAFAISYLWSDLQVVGEIIYESSKNGEVVSEMFSNTDDTETASISFQYYAGVPFPFISEAEVPVEPIYNVLNRGQRFWLYESAAIIDANGTVVGYGNDFQYKYDDKLALEGFAASFIYDDAGRLITVVEEFLAEDGTDALFPSNMISIDYYDTGALETVDYLFSPRFGARRSENQRNRGTTDGSGRIRYDEQGRMVYRSYYVTHGRHYCVYLYEDNTTRPWAIVEFCSMVYSSEAGYGNDASIYLFLESK